MPILYLNKKDQSGIGIVLLAILLGLLGYGTSRNDFFTYFGLYSLAFGTYAFVLRHAFRSAQPTNMLYYIGAAILLRLVLLGMQPNLSDDFYRFVWDGRLSAAGINPFLYRPDELLNRPIFEQLQLKTLYEGNTNTDWPYYSGLNSKSYYSVYPTALQLIFLFSAWLFPDNLMGTVIIMRLFIVGAELGTLLFSLKILGYRNLDPRLLLCYAFNPLIVLEWTGNLHFEALAIFFLSASVWFLFQKKLILSTFFLSGAVVSKLIPLLYLPIFFSFLGWKKWLQYSILSGMWILIFLAPFFYHTNTIANLSKSIGLYFNSFEFNASFYYLLQAFLGIFTDAIPRPQLALSLNLMVLGFIFYLSFWRKATTLAQVQNYMLWALTAYFLATRTVHPWYIGSLLWLAIFTTQRYPFYWSFLVGLSYVTYFSGNFEEQNWVIFIEYIVLFAIMLKDYASPQSPNSPPI